jgi:hypothetical protein
MKGRKKIKYWRNKHQYNKDSSLLSIIYCHESFWGLKWRTTLPPSASRLCIKWEPRLLAALWVSRPVTGVLLPLRLPFFVKRWNVICRIYAEWNDGFHDWCLVECSELSFRCPYESDTRQGHPGNDCETSTDTREILHRNYVGHGSLNWECLLYAQYYNPLYQCHRIIVYQYTDSLMPFHV